MDLQLRDKLRPLAEAIAPSSSLRDQRNVRQAFREDGELEHRVVTSAFPVQRLDWVVAPGAPAGVQVARFHIFGASKLRNIAMIATTNVSATFQVDVLVNGARATSGAIRAGTSQAKGALNVLVPAGSVVSVETKSSIAQGVTVSVFYRPTEEA